MPFFLPAPGLAPPLLRRTLMTERFCHSLECFASTLNSLSRTSSACSRVSASTSRSLMRSGLRSSDNVAVQVAILVD